MARRPLWPRLFAARPAARPRARLGLEAFEDRVTPATFTVTNTLDDNNPGCLRWAVGQANSNAEADTIVFALPANSTRTITLDPTRGQLTLTATAQTTIDGGAAGVTINGNYRTRLFQVGVTVVAYA